MKFRKIKSFAKINISLNITGKLKSKLHRIESLITFVNLFDVIYIKKIKAINHKIYFIGKFSKGISKRNTISKLIKILDIKKILNNQKFEIKIIKNIPQQSGMGGGSMNVASLVNYFKKNKIIKINKKDILNIINSISSDALLGMSKNNTILSSNGNVKRFKKKLNYYVLIVKPNFGCSTKLIYSAVKNFSRSQYNIPKKILFNEKNILKSRNDLEDIAFYKYPQLKKIKFFLSNLPNIIFVRMTGSGSSIVGYFRSKKALNAAARLFNKEYNGYWYIKSKTI
jgi:4-diphosphocytidyl-2-C-methyl-D-erythritol kinase